MECSTNTTYNTLNEVKSDNNVDCNWSVGGIIPTGGGGAVLSALEPLVLPNIPYILNKTVEDSDKDRAALLLSGETPELRSPCIAWMTAVTKFSF